jgi:hypothetical protein
VKYITLNTNKASWAFQCKRAVTEATEKIVTQVNFYSFALNW